MSRENIAYSKEHILFLKNIKKRKLFVIFTQILIMVVFLCIWELASYLKIINPFLYSSPSRIFSTMFNLFISNNLIGHIRITLFETIFSFLVASSIGFLIATILFNILIAALSIKSQVQSQRMQMIQPELNKIQAKYEGKTIRVRGFAIKKADFLPNGYFAIGKYAISCCAADAGFTGFMSKYDNDKIKVNRWYEVEGILRKGKDKDNNDTMYIEVINIKEIDSKKEEQYVYPCYSYGDNSCSEMTKYNLEY